MKAFTHIGIKDWNSIFWTHEEGGGGDMGVGGGRRKDNFFFIKQ